MSNQNAEVYDTKAILALIANVEAADKAKQEAKEKLNAALFAVELGTVFLLNGEQMQVSQYREEKDGPLLRRLTFVFSERQRAIMAGKKPPPMRVRQSAAMKAEEAGEAVTETAPLAAVPPTKDKRRAS